MLFSVRRTQQVTMFGALMGVSPVAECMNDALSEHGGGEKALLTRTPTRSIFLEKHHGPPMKQRTLKVDHASSVRKTLAFWTLVSLLSILAVGNLLLTATILGVLRLGKGMESIQFLPEHDAVQLLGRVELEHVYKRDGLIEGWRDVPMGIESDGGQVLFNLQTRQSQPETKLRVSRSGVSIKGVSAFRVRDHQGRRVFSSEDATMHLPHGANSLAAQVISTKRIASPIDEPLHIRSEASIHLRGAEGTHMESKELLWSADQDIYLKSVNGSVVLSAKEGVYIDVKNIPIALPHVRTDKSTGQFKVCVCMPQGKLFRIAVPSGQKVSCSHVNMTQEHNPCI